LVPVLIEEFLTPKDTMTVREHDSSPMVERGGPPGGGAVRRKGHLRKLPPGFAIQLDHLNAQAGRRSFDLGYNPALWRANAPSPSSSSMLGAAKKLGVNGFQYIRDRISGARKMPALADLIQQQARTRGLGSSWAGL
jgi:hypothetical protein